MTEEPPEKQNKTIINIIMLIIVVVWAVSILFDALKRNATPPGVNAALMIVVAFLFNAKGVKTNENGTNGNGGEVKK